MVTTRQSAARQAAEAAAAASGADSPAAAAQHANGTTPSKQQAAKGTKHSQETHYEFFGPHGPLLLTFALPAVVYGLYFGCNQTACLQVWPSFQLPASLPPNLRFFSWEAVAVFTAWYVGLSVAHLVLPGKMAQGVVLPDGSRLTYKLNAFRLWALAYGACLYFGFATPPSSPWHLPLSWLYDHYLPLLTASVLFSTLLSVYLYVSSFKPGAMLSGHGSSGWWWYDFWMGRELNPRIGMYDFKQWCELSPGMIGWSLLNLAMAHKQWVTLGRVTNSVVLVSAFQLSYVLDALWYEESILTTMDITTDGFGFMLAFGDLTWVPFVFTTSTRFLTDHTKDLSPLAVAAVLCMKLLGYWVFRGANGQKDTFRRDPNHPSVRHLKTLPTQRGTKLIISGWWGMSRHINYFGDWIMGVSWCMPCGLTGLCAVIPYFYCIYFATLLIHRERRDDAACKAKYGKDWDKYCKLVPYRIIPYVY